MRITRRDLRLTRPYTGPASAGFTRLREPLILERVATLLAGLDQRQHCFHETVPAGGRHVAGLTKPWLEFVLELQPRCQASSGCRTE